MIVAFDAERGIGKYNDIPWNIPNDLKRFSKLTRGDGNNAIIMGRNTWESLPRKPLPKRDNLIMSRTLDIEENLPKNILIKSFKSKEDIIAFCEEKCYDTVWIIGGEQIYKEFINDDKLNLIYITFILEKHGCDTFFPAFHTKWKLTYNELYEVSDYLSIYYQIYSKDREFNPKYDYRTNERD